LVWAHSRRAAGPSDTDLVQSKRNVKYARLEKNLLELQADKRYAKGKESMAGFNPHIAGWF